MKIIDAVKIWLKTRAIEKEALTEVKTMNDDIKPGWKTTEFWGKNFAQIVTVGIMIATVFGKTVTPEQQSAIVTTGTVVIGALEAVYNLVRGWTKTS